jgi:hypothetical protein
MAIVTKTIRLLSKPADFNIGFKVFVDFRGLLSKSDYRSPLFSVLPVKLRLSTLNAEQLADPFLCVKDNCLYCFYEEKSRINPGKIRVIKYSTDGSVTYYDCDLGINSHTSFPFLYQAKSGNYMIPETATINEVALYKVVNFPQKWEKQSILLRGNFVDSHMFFYNNIYYLFTTEKISLPDSKQFDYQLMLFTSSELTSGFVSHPMNPIVKGRKFSRSGGGIIQENGNVYRVAQDCHDKYGRELNIFKINLLSLSEYKEELVAENWVSRTFGYPCGGHHLNTCEWNNQIYCAVDFNIKDSYFQRFINAILQ